MSSFRDDTATANAAAPASRTAEPWDGAEAAVMAMFMLAWFVDHTMMVD